MDGEVKKVLFGVGAIIIAIITIAGVLGKDVGSIITTILMAIAK
jgi:hypothetical protein